MEVRETQELIKVTRIRRDIVHVRELGPGDRVMIDHDTTKEYIVTSEPKLMKRIQTIDPTSVKGGSEEWYVVVEEKEQIMLQQTQAIEKGQAAWQVDVELCS